jgi:hypothetical protein
LIELVDEPTPVFKPLEISPSVDKELERLHNILLSQDADKDFKKWAKEKIEHIHSLFFTCAIMLKQESKPKTKGKQNEK